MSNTKELWEKLHAQSRFRPKYPSEIVVQYVFRNFKRDGKTKVLDLGCGAGRHSYFMAKENLDVYGVDISAEGIAYTEKMFKQDNLKGQFKVGTIAHIPYDNDYFDGIISCGVLYYCMFNEIEKSAGEIYRVLKKGGKALLVIRTINDYRYGEGKEIEKNTFLIEEKDKEKCAFNENGMKMHFFTKEEVLKLFYKFSDIKIDTVEQTSENGKYKDSNFLVKLVK